MIFKPRVFAPEIEQALTTPHAYEDSEDGMHRPVWLIWERIPGEFPYLRMVGLDEGVVRACLDSIIPIWEAPRTYVTVERIPANHVFASSLSEEIDKVTRRKKNEFKYRREGD